MEKKGVSGCPEINIFPISLLKWMIWLMYYSHC